MFFENMKIVFFKFFFLKMPQTLENDNNWKLSFVQTLSELFRLFYSYDARLFIKMRYMYEGAVYESSIRFEKFKIADPIRWIKFWINSNFFGEN